MGVLVALLVGTEDRGVVVYEHGQDREETRPSQAPYRVKGCGQEARVCLGKEGSQLWV